MEYSTLNWLDRTFTSPFRQGKPFVARFFSPYFTQMRTAIFNQTPLKPTEFSIS